MLFLLLTGGEPFLYPEFRKLYMGLRKMGMILTINTNGTLIDEDLAAFLGANKPRRVNITLYGTDEKAYAELCHYPGGFEKTMNGIRLLRKYGVDVKIGGSLVKANRGDLDRLLDLGDELGVRGAGADPCTEAGDGAGAFCEVCRGIRQKSGSAGTRGREAGTYGVHGGAVLLYYKLAGRDAPLCHPEQSGGVCIRRGFPGGMGAYRGRDREDPPERKVQRLLHAPSVQDMRGVSASGRRKL